MKRKALAVQKIIFKAIKENSGISMSTLERKVGTNPRSLKEHCENLAYFNLIRIVKEKNTTRLYVAQEA